jgi:hypothetical protein
MQFSSQLDQVLSQLEEAETDEQHLVALTMLPRILTHDNPKDMIKAANAIPWKFINRLLTTRDDGMMMPTIGLDIWSFFTQISHIPQILKRIPTCISLVKDMPESCQPVLQSLVELSISTDGCNALASQTVFDFFQTILNSNDESHISLVIIIISNMLEKIIEYESNVNLSNLFLVNLGNICRTSQSQLKFEAIELCVKLLCVDEDVN